MKVGDKLLCKNTNNNHFNISSCFTINKYYDIILIDDGKIKINNDYTEIFMFSFDDNYVLHIWDFFYTKEEMRKKKINSI
ncbi:hypothetical protein M0Q50_02230 [bacterium]|jgi:hypothetical protein|nr:hypothetical protein [bacterium]